MPVEKCYVIRVMQFARKFIELWAILRQINPTNFQTLSKKTSCICIEF